MPLPVQAISNSMKSVYLFADALHGAALSSSGSRPRWTPCGRAAISGEVVCN